MFRINKLITGFLLGVTSMTAQSAVTFFTDVATFNNASTTSIIEDFEVFSPKDQPLSSFTSNGITYSSSINVWVASPGYTNFGVPITTSSVLTATGNEDFFLTFNTPVTAIGFDTYLNFLGPVTVEVIGNSGILDSFNPSHNVNQVGFLGITSTEVITSIRWKAVGGHIINTGIDNIYTGKRILLVELYSFITKELIEQNYRRFFLFWETASEADNAGFRLWRSTEDSDGGYTNVTALEGLNSHQKDCEEGKLTAVDEPKQLITAVGNSRKGACYSFEDTSINEDGTYYYVLEDIETNGKRTFHCDYMDAVIVGEGPEIDLEAAKRFCQQMTGNVE